MFPLDIGKFTILNRNHGIKEAEELIPLELCQAPHIFFDPLGIVVDIFKTNKLKYPTHATDASEEQF